VQHKQTHYNSRLSLSVQNKLRNNILGILKDSLYWGSANNSSSNYFHVEFACMLLPGYKYTFTVSMQTKFHILNNLSQAVTLLTSVPEVCIANLDYSSCKLALISIISVSPSRYISEQCLQFCYSRCLHSHSNLF
jgi:hypothetical protein